MLLFGESGSFQRKWAELVLIKWDFRWERKELKSLWKLMALTFAWVIWT